MKLLGERHEKFDLVSFTMKLNIMEPRNPLWMRKHFVTDRCDPTSILKKRHGLNNSSLENDEAEVELSVESRSFVNRVE